jgi:hypothetical protein
MNSFSEYMDKVKAEKELKTKTEAFVRTVLSNTEGQERIADSGLEFKKGKSTRNRFLAAVSAVAACLILALGGNAYYHTPIHYLCLDINPSVELGINAFDRVVSAQAYNEDGRELLGDHPYSNLSVETAVSSLVLDAVQQGFVAGDGSTVIAVTAESNKSQAAVKLQNSGESGAESALNAGGISAIVYSDSTDLQLRKQAQDLGISPGKLRLISILQTLDPSVSIAAYKNAKTTDIMTKAAELLAQSGDGWENGDEADILEKIRDVAERVQASYEYAEREQSRSGTQNQSRDSGQQEQNQNQNQCSNDNEIQNQVQSRDLEIKQPVQNQSSDNRQQQAQNPEEKTQNPVQEGSTSVSGQNQGQPAGTQSENGETVQDTGDNGKMALAFEEPGTDAGGSQTSSASEEPGTDAGGSQTSSASEEPGTDAGGSQISSASEEPGTDAGGSQTSSASEEPGTDAGGSQISSASEEPGTDAGGSQISSASEEPGNAGGSSSSSGAPSENGRSGR